MRAQALPTFGQFLLMMAIALTGCAASQTASPTPSTHTPTTMPPIATDEQAATPTLSPPPPTPAPLIATNQMPKVQPVLLYDEWPSAGFPNDPAQVTITDFENNILTLKVVYFGGCRVHTFELHAFTAFMLSKPPQGTLYLSNDAHGDTCTMQIAKFLKFDLTPLNKERNDPSEHPLHLWLSAPVGGGFSEPLRPRIEWP